MKIANIIYEKELVSHTQVDYINYFNKPQNYNSVDKTLPTLYVGWSFMKACNPFNEIIQNANILHKKIIANELYWECSFEESKPSHVKGIKSFVNLAPKFYFQPKYNFINLDPIFFQIKDVQDLIDIVPKKIDFLYNFRHEMIYLLTGNKITSIDLKIYDFFQFNINEIELELRAKTAKCYDDLDGSIYQSYYKILPNFLCLKRYLIVLLSM